MVAHICHVLFPLASLTEQERYMVHAIPEQYLLPHDLLNDAFHVVSPVEENSPWTRRMSEQEKAAVLRFGVVLRSQSEQIDVDKLAWVDLVHHCPVWKSIRLAAQDCLSSLGCMNAA